MRILKIVAGLALVSPIANGAAISPIVTNPANGHQYLLLEPDNWISSELSALAYGGHLATVNDSAENTFLLSTFGNFGGQQRLLWVGYHDVGSEGNYKWVSGQPTTYTNWTPGEPNGGGGENYAAIYYPNHSSAGRWNDWGSRSTDPIGLPMNGVIELDPSNIGNTFTVVPDFQTLVIAPVGNLEGSPLNNVGLAWEASHGGWNSNKTYDVNGWSPATFVGPSIWAAGSNTPIYGRRLFHLDEVPAYATLLGGADDDVQIYINGNLVVNDANGGANDFGPVDITRYLIAGDNLMAFKAHDSFGSSQSFKFGIAGILPEPATLLPVTALAAALISRPRRLRAKVSSSKQKRAADRNRRRV